MSYYIDQNGTLHGGGESSLGQDAEEVSDLFMGLGPAATRDEDSPPQRPREQAGEEPSPADEPLGESDSGRRTGGLGSSHTLEPMKPPLSPKRRRVARVLDENLVQLVSDAVIILRDTYQVEPDHIDSSWLAAALLGDWTPERLAKAWMEHQYNGP